MYNTVDRHLIADDKIGQADMKIMTSCKRGKIINTFRGYFISNCQFCMLFHLDTLILLLEGS